MSESYEDNLVPLYYSVSPKLTKAQVANVLHVLRMTPIAAVFIVDVHDCNLAMKLSEVVLQKSTSQEAHERARTYGSPTVIVTGDIEINAYYQDGHTEEIILPNEVWSGEVESDGQAQDIHEDRDWSFGGDRQIGIDR